jgi:digeranylgeranylglycerophospholipid reductase
MEIVIIGAGPVGCYTAQQLKKMGYHPVILEEHASVGKPVQCAGVVSKNFITQIKPFISNESIINQINGFRIFTPWVEDFPIEIPEIAYIIDREKFDLSLGKGLDICLNQRVSSLKKEGNRYVIKTHQGEIYETDVLIGADGPDSIVRKFLLEQYGKNKGKLPVKVHYYFGIQYQIQLHHDYKFILHDRVQVFFNHQLPFFIWIIPENRGRLRVGVMSYHGNQNQELLTHFMHNQNIKGKIIDIISGKISLGFIPTCYQNIALVGDAACQMKPITGGGLSFGLQSANILADCIKENRLEKYDGKWKRKLGREIQFGLKAREVYESLDNKQREKIFQLFRKNSHLIEQVVDFDHHSTLFIEALKRPKLLLEAGTMLRFYLKDMLKY